METFGVVGLGNMGLNMAKTLLRKDCQVIGYDTNQEQVAQLVKAGGIAAASAQEVAQQCSTVILSLPNSPITEQVVLGTQGILDGAGPSSLIIDMGSSVPASTRL